MSNAIQRLNKGQNLPKKLIRQDDASVKIGDDVASMRHRVDQVETQLLETVQVIPQSFTTEQKAQARQNIGVNIVEYFDTDKPNAALGDQWVRVDSASNGGALNMVYGLGLCICSMPTKQTARLRTQSSIGVI